VDTVATRTCCGPRVEIDPDDRRRRDLNEQMGRNGPTPRAQVEGTSVAHQQRRGTAGEVLGLGTRHVDARRELELTATEVDPARDPARRFPLLASTYPRGEGRPIGCRGEERRGLAVDIDAPGGGQAVPDLTQLGFGELDHQLSVAGGRACRVQRSSSMMRLNVGLGRMTAAALTGSGL